MKKMLLELILTKKYKLCRKISIEKSLSLTPIAILKKAGYNNPRVRCN